MLAGRSQTTSTAMLAYVMLRHPWVILDGEHHRIRPSLTAGSWWMRYITLAEGGHLRCAEVNVIQYEPICMAIDTPYPSSGHDEDCLFMNIWTPSNATAASKLPVWLFIQGGGEPASVLYIKRL